MSLGVGRVSMAYDSKAMPPPTRAATPRNTSTAMNPGAPYRCNRRRALPGRRHRRAAAAVAPAGGDEAPVDQLRRGVRDGHAGDGLGRLESADAAAGDGVLGVALAGQHDGDGDLLGEGGPRHGGERARGRGEQQRREGGLKSLRSSVQICQLLDPLTIEEEEWCDPSWNKSLDEFPPTLA